MYKLAKIEYSVSIIANMEYSEDYKKRFTELINDMDCKNSEIPKLLKIDYGSYMKMKEFGIIPKPKVLVRIADYFEVSLEYLLGRTNDPYFSRAEKDEDFLTRYRRLKEEEHFTDYKIAQKLHITTSYTTNWKNKNFIPSIVNLIVLADTFGVSLDYLLGRTDEKKGY